MIKKLSLLVVLSILASAIPASAQAVRYGYIPQSPEGWYYAAQGDQVAMLTADNLDMVRRSTNQLRRAEFRSVADNLRWNGNDAYGVYTERGFYPMYDRNMRPMGRREATATGAVIGAGAGYAIFGNSRGTVAGAVVGGVVGLLTHRGNNRDVVTMPPPDQPQPSYPPNGVQYPVRDYQEPPQPPQADYVGFCGTEEELATSLKRDGISVRSLNGNPTRIRSEYVNASVKVYVKGTTLMTCTLNSESEKIFVVPFSTGIWADLKGEDRNHHTLWIVNQIDYFALPSGAGFIFSPKACRESAAGCGGKDGR